MGEPFEVGQLVYLDRDRCEFPTPEMIRNMNGDPRSFKKGEKVCYRYRNNTIVEAKHLFGSSIRKPDIRYIRLPGFKWYQGYRVDWYTIGKIRPEDPLIPPGNNINIPVAQQVSPVAPQNPAQLVNNIERTEPLKNNNNNTTIKGGKRSKKSKKTRKLKKSKKGTRRH